MDGKEDVKPNSKLVDLAKEKKKEKTPEEEFKSRYDMVVPIPIQGTPVAPVSEDLRKARDPKKEEEETKKEEEETK